MNSINVCRECGQTANVMGFCEAHPSAIVDTIVSSSPIQEEDKFQLLLKRYKERHSGVIPLKTEHLLKRAIELGADDDLLHELVDAIRVSGGNTIVIPSGKYERLSRGKGWARKGKGNSAEWGERVDGGYRVGAGRWTVGSTDGFSRKSSVEWDVKHVLVGSETWTIAN